MSLWVAITARVWASSPWDSAVKLGFSQICRESFRYWFWRRLAREYRSLRSRLSQQLILRVADFRRDRRLARVWLQRGLQANEFASGDCADFLTADGAEMRGIELPFPGGRAQALASFGS